MGSSTSGLSSMKNLTFINLFGCQLIKKLPGLYGVTALQEPNILKTRICKLPNFGKLCQLQNLIAWKYHNLGSLAGLQYVTSLESLDASDCENLREVPDFSGMQELEMLDLSGSGDSNLSLDLNARTVTGLDPATKLNHVDLGRSG
jgi:internalin A